MEKIDGSQEEIIVTREQIKSAYCNSCLANNVGGCIEGSQPIHDFRIDCGIYRSGWGKESGMGIAYESLAAYLSNPCGSHSPIRSYDCIKQEDCNSGGSICSNKVKNQLAFLEALHKEQPTELREVNYEQEKIKLEELNKRVLSGEKITLEEFKK